jgi:hypothetical protein
LGRWLDRIPDAYRAYQSDPLYRVQVAHFRQWLVSFEMAMQDEGVEPASVERVINRVVYGCPDVAPALERMAKYDEEIRNAMSTSLSGLVRVPGRRV